MGPVESFFEGARAVSRAIRATANPLARIPVDYTWVIAGASSQLQ